MLIRQIQLSEIEQYTIELFRDDIYSFDEVVDDVVDSFFDIVCDENSLSCEQFTTDDFSIEITSKIIDIVRYTETYYIDNFVTE